MGIVQNIQHFCLNDGDGIRTTVFLSGCPLHCAWCHNPETQSVTPTLSYDAEKCIGCRECATRCTRGCHRFDSDIHTLVRENCTGCGECVSPTCPALSYLGQDMTAYDVITEVEHDMPFYTESGGGLTLSGGEPLFSPDFTYEILCEARKRGIGCAIETCGYAPREVITRLAPLVSTFLYDWKLSDGDLHKKYTGVDNELIRSNLLYIDGLGCDIVLRCPIIPNINDNDSHFSGIAKLTDELKHLRDICIEPYHSIG